MPVNYKVEQTSDKKFSVKEVKTEQIIKVFSNNKDAREYMKGLNLGRGFDGWSPSFILKKVAEI